MTATLTLDHILGRSAESEAARAAFVDVTSLIAPAPVLTLDDYAAVLKAIGDREDQVGPDERARLARGRLALELQAAELLDQ